MLTVGSGDTARAPLAVCTIVSKNYLPQARTLHASLQATNPGCPFYVLLVDRPEGYFDPKAEPFPIIPIEALPIPDLPRVCFQYNLLELNTAAKPFFMQFLMEHYGIEKLIYFDPDILVLNNLQSLADLLNRYSIVLTPHLTSAQPEDSWICQEVTVLCAGAYNLGFIAVSAGPVTKRFLEWWGERLETYCLNKPEQGLMVDQKWIDLVPGMFEKVHVLTEPGYNVAYWNIGSRHVTFQDDRILVNGKPAYFFHFSAFNPLKPNGISKYQSRFTLDDVGEVRRLYLDYAQRLFRHGYKDCIAWPYAYGSFDNGTPISPLVRHIYWELGDRARAFGNPFCTEPPNSYYRWLTGTANGARKQGRPFTNLASLRAAFRFVGKHANPFTTLASLRAALRFVVRKTGKIVYHALRKCLLRIEARAGWSGKDVADEHVLYHRAEPFRQSLAQARKPANLDRNSRASAKTRVPTTPRWTRASKRPFGVNLAGYFQSEKGVGEAARAVIRALRAAKVPFVLNNVSDSGSVNKDLSASEFAETNPYAFNVLQVNADQAAAFARMHPHYFQGHYNVGYWNWELAEFPAEWRQGFDYFDEVWAPSTFTQKAIAAASPIPVRCIPFAIAGPEEPPLGVGPGSFRLPPDVFVFLFAFDLMSFLERKNPHAVVQAFHRAFGNRSGVHLVLKTMHAAFYPSEYDLLKAACQGHTNITLVQEVLTRAEMQMLMRCCSAYISLHRCEGFGLTLAEAMALGKPVIAPLYSANADFMDATNCCPVRFRLVEIGADHGPYRRGHKWADPDVDHAAEWMRRLVEDPSELCRIGQKAQLDITHTLSPRRIGELIRSSLAALSRRKEQRNVQFPPGPGSVGRSWLALRAGMTHLLKPPAKHAA